VLTKKEKKCKFLENRYVTVFLFDFSLRIMDLGLGFDDEDFESKKQSGQENKKSYNAKFCSEYVSIKGYFFKGCIEW
jgi:hypothetical protein